MTSTDRVVLIGPRGAGKSTVAPLLAAALGVPAVDSDAEVERETGETVAALLRDGRFRARERRVLARILAGPPAVVAAGGGAVLWDGFAAAAHGWCVVWLDADPAVLAVRIAAEPGRRPPLLGDDAAAEIAAVAAAREARYRAAAAHRVATDACAPAAVVARVKELLHGDA